MLRDTSGQDRAIERGSYVRRNSRLLLTLGGAAIAALLLVLYLMHYAGAGNSVDRTEASSLNAIASCYCQEAWDYS